MPKQEVVCFKVDAATAEAMRGIPNRSDFLRTAVLAALRNTCPVCRGTGRLSPRQMEHWRVFAETHAFEKCADCQEYHWVCAGHPDACHSTTPVAKASAARQRARPVDRASAGSRKQSTSRTSP